MQALELLQRRRAGVHFYTLNRSPATRAIVSALLAASAWRPAFSSDQRNNTAVNRRVTAAASV